MSCELGPQYCSDILWLNYPPETQDLGSWQVYQHQLLVSTADSKHLRNKDQSSEYNFLKEQSIR